MTHSPDNAIFMGPARSGTTLACNLLNKLPNVVALDEPFERRLLQEMAGPDAFLAAIADKFTSQRAMIETRGEAHSTLSKGGQLSNHYATEPSSTTLRKRQVALDRMSGVNVTRRFKLIIKHTLPFTALFDELVQRYATFVIIRNPLAILASWNSIDAAYRDGRIQPYVRPLASTDLLERLRALGDRFARQITLLQWHFEQYRPALRAAKVVRYENVVDTNGKALRLIVPSARNLYEDLESHNTNPLYDRDLIWELKEKLLATRGAIWDFYTPSDVERLFDEMTGPSPN